MNLTLLGPNGPVIFLLCGLIGLDSCVISLCLFVIWLPGLPVLAMEQDPLLPFPVTHPWGLASEPLHPGLDSPFRCECWGPGKLLG